MRDISVHEKLFSSYHVHGYIGLVSSPCEYAY